jgi:Protein of unknown function (DUF3037)
MTRVPFEYAVLRVVPRVERGESINAGVVVYSQRASFLGARVHLDADRLRALDPSADIAAIDAALQSAAQTCNGAGEEIGRRFRWLTAPRSTVVQPGPVHTGLTADASAEPDRLLALLVLALA